jgi:two-component system chemotaxis sensor kinase CheA
LNEFIDQFLIEGRELIEQATADLLALEKQPADPARVDSVFRAFHTLKGAAGIVDFAAMARALHAAEDVLSSVRAGSDPVTPVLIGDCLSSLDQVVQWLDAIEASGDIPSQADVGADAIVARFVRAPAGMAAPADAVASALPPVIDQVEIVALDQAPRDLPTLGHEILHAQILMLEAAEARGTPGSLASAGRVVANVLRHAGRTTEIGGLDAVAAAVLAAGDPGPLIAAIRTLLAEPSNGSAPEDAAGYTAPAQEIAARTLRVDVDRIDALVRLTGELTVIKNAIGHVSRLAEGGEDPRALAANLKDQHILLDRLTTELQHAVLSVRVLPLRHIFQRFPRLVRDLGGSLGKPLRLVTEGDDTEADKAIVESLFEPLLHVLRNAADHGLENANDRRAAGKPPQGTIWLRAVRLGEKVVVEIADDGRGIDVDRVRQVAARNGIASPETLAGMSEADIVGLIFAPGFSTATRITGVSGRGVGMDAVRSAVERLGGRVGVESRTGQGTTVRFTLPFTIMITRVMTVEAGGQTFGIPLDSVMETVRIGRERIVPVGAAHAFTLRNRVVPLFDLAETLGIARTRSGSEDAIVVVAAIGGDVGGLLVDRLGERMDVMLKSMDGLLSGTPGVAGTALLGDGRVMIVLDLPELLR